MDLLWTKTTKLLLGLTVGLHKGCFPLSCCVDDLDCCCCSYMDYLPLMHSAVAAGMIHLVHPR